MCGCGAVVPAVNNDQLNNINIIESSKTDRSNAVLIEMHVSCKNLKTKFDRKSFGKNLCLFCILFTRNKETLEWENIAQTEIVYNQLNPIFGKPLISSFCFEKVQQMQIRVYDVDNEELRNTCIGRAEFRLHELVSAENHILVKELNNNNKEAGTVSIRGEIAATRFSSNIAIMTIDGSSIKSAKNHFYILLRSEGESEFQLIHKSEVVHGYKWKALKIPTADLFCDDEKRLLQIQIFEFSSYGNHKLLISKEFTFADLKDGYLWESAIGPIKFKNVRIESRFSFLDYVFSGCQISLSIAIDFTASNGYPRSKSSLHYFNPKTNPYLSAIKSIGGVLQDYDSDKQIPVFGFGAQPLEVNKISHCFALNGNIFSPEIHTIDSVIDVYRKNILKLQFSGPTNFSEIIGYIGNFAEWNVNNGNLHNYFVVMILTDGQITDAVDTIDEIVRCSYLPISIIIVGVGTRDFSSMDLLKSNINPLYSKKYEKYAIRNIVQFVPFNKFAGDEEKLTAETLEGLPNQLVDYMTMKGLPPKESEDEEMKADFYTIRKEKFIEKLGNLAKGQDAQEMIETGFPVENVNVFVEMVNSGYKNTLIK